MAEWNVSLPVAAVEGADTHVADHNLVYDALKEVRTNVDEHKHDAADITSGTLAAGRIPTLAQSKVTGLSAALEAKAEAETVSALEARIEALEAKLEGADE